MITYFAGVPGGNQNNREEMLEEDGVKFRLITFFYKSRALVTLKHYKKLDFIELKGERDYGS